MIKVGKAQLISPHIRELSSFWNYMAIKYNILRYHIEEFESLLTSYLMVIKLYIIILSLYKSPIEKLCNHFLNCTLTEGAARTGPIRSHVRIIATKR